MDEAALAQRLSSLGETSRLRGVFGSFTCFDFDQRDLDLTRCHLADSGQVAVSQTVREVVVDRKDTLFIPEPPELHELGITTDSSG